MKVGVCLFDDVDIASSGWISIAGLDSARINDMAELRSDVFWITNIPYRKFRENNFNHSQNMSDDQFFRTKLESIIKEITSSEDPEVQCKLASQTLHRVAELGDYYFNVKIGEDNEYRYQHMLQSSLLTNDMRRNPKGDSEVDIKEAIEQSYQMNQSSTQKNNARGSKAESFVFPRASYAKWLLNMEYPTGNEWTEIEINTSEKESLIIGYEDGAILPKTKKVIEDFKDIDKKEAAFFRITVLSSKPNYSRISKFGASGINQSVRRWATLPEVIDILRYSKVEIFYGYKIKKEKIKIDQRIFEDYEYSISKGILLENVWVALASPPYSRSRDNVSAIGSYMRAYDRIACGRAAATFMDHSYTVGSYGLGRVQVFLRKNEHKGAKQIALNNELMPRMGLMTND